MKNIRKTGFLLLALALLLTMSACGGAAPVPEENSPVIPEETAAVPEEAITVPAESPTLQAESPAAGCYTQISQALAKAMMGRDDGHIVVDVRRQDEYDAGHIPGAILLPNESIGTELPAELPDLEQIILIYCRSGNRSKQASQKLADMGYTNVYEFGGIIDWPYEIVREDAG